MNSHILLAPANGRWNPGEQKNQNQCTVEVFHLYKKTASKKLGSFNETVSELLD